MCYKYVYIYICIYLDMYVDIPLSLSLGMCAFTVMFTGIMRFGPKQCCEAHCQQFMSWWLQKPEALNLQP